MPFIALNKSTKERIDITKIENPRLVLKKEEVICQLCESPMTIKAGMVRRHHFAHHSLCESDYEYHPESPEHLIGKEKIAQALKVEFAEYTNADIEFERKIEDIKRVADILITFPNGWRIAHEVQLASITIEELQARTDDYARAGIDVVWWLGKSADSPSNRDWCVETFGVSYSLEISKLVS